MAAITLPHEFDVSEVTYGAPKKNDNGGKSIYINYKKAPLVIQLPEMQAPFGLSKWTNDGKTKYTLDLSFNGRSERKVLNSFFENMLAFDKKLLTDSLDNSPTWFNKKYNSIEVVEALYTPSIKFAKDKNGEIVTKYEPTFKMSLPMNKEGTGFACEVYDNNKNKVNLTDLDASGAMKGARVSAIVQCLGIWVAGTKFGCSWKVLQMKVSPRSTISGYAFKDLEEKVPETQSDNEADAEDIHNHAVVSDGSDKEDENVNVDDIVESDDDLDAKPSQAAVTGKRVVVRAKKN